MPLPNVLTPRDLERFHRVDLLQIQLLERIARAQEAVLAHISLPAAGSPSPAPQGPPEAPAAPRRTKEKR